MNSSSLRLKNARNWFAAGVEVQQALEFLSDGAFKVFMYICLNAERAYRDPAYHPGRSGANSEKIQRHDPQVLGRNGNGRHLPERL